MRKEVIKKLIERFGQPYSEELGIDLDSGEEEEVFKWFLASILFGKRIGEGIAKATYQEFKRAEVLSPRAILDTEGGEVWW